MGCDSQFDGPVLIPAAKPKRKIQMYRYETIPDGVTPKVEAEIESELLGDISEIMRRYAYHQTEYDIRLDQQSSVRQQLLDLERRYNEERGKLLLEQQEALEKAQLYADLVRQDVLDMVQLWKRVYGKK